MAILSRRYAEQKAARQAAVEEATALHSQLVRIKARAEQEVRGGCTLAPRSSLTRACGTDARGGGGKGARRRERRCTRRPVPCAHPRVPPQRLAAELRTVSADRARVKVEAEKAEAQARAVAVELAATQRELKVARTDAEAQARVAEQLRHAVARRALSPRPLLTFRRRP